VNIVAKKIIEINCCFECPNSCWNETYKDFECKIYDNTVIDAIEEVADWCPLPDAPLFKSATKKKNLLKIDSKERLT